MWRFSSHDVAAGAQNALSAPLHGRLGPPKRTERSFTNPSGCFLLVVGWVLIFLTFFVPYFIGRPDPNRLTFGTDYNGAGTVQARTMWGGEGGVCLPLRRAVAAA